MKLTLGLFVRFRGAARSPTAAPPTPAVDPEFAPIPAAKSAPSAPEADRAPTDPDDYNDHHDHPRPRGRKEEPMNLIQIGSIILNFDLVAQVVDTPGRLTIIWTTGGCYNLFGAEAAPLREFLRQQAQRLPRPERTAANPFDA